MGAAISNGHSERHRLKHGSIHQPLTPAHQGSFAVVTDILLWIYIYRPLGLHTSFFGVKYIIVKVTYIVLWSEIHRPVGIHTLSLEVTTSSFGVTMGLCTLCLGFMTHHTLAAVEVSSGCMVPIPSVEV